VTSRFHNTFSVSYALSQQDQAERFAARHALPCFQSDSHPGSAYVLHYSDTGVQLIQTGKGAPGPVSASFLSGKALHRLRFGGGKGQMIAKAVGLKSGKLPHVFDATAGLGQDAFVLASLGCTLTMCERSPWVAELLRSALDQAKDSSRSDPEVVEIATRMTLIETDAAEYLSEGTEPLADVIYLDPMYPHTGKSAQVKKEMRVFQELIGRSDDDHLLLEAALQRARYRVVVKRPRKGELLGAKKPNLQIEGKSSRFDIYTLSKML